MRYAEADFEELQKELESVKEKLCCIPLPDRELSMARGKPGPGQLDAVSGLLRALTEKEDCITDGIDARNYGALPGLPCAAGLWAELLDCRPEQVFTGDRSSLNLMYQVISIAFSHGLLRSHWPL